MAWLVQRTASFDKWWNKEDVDSGNYKYHEAALKEFKNICMPHGSGQSRIFVNSSYECWVVRLPDKMRNQGKRGSFRVVIILDLEEGILLLQGMFRRKNLQDEGRPGKYDNQYEDLLKDLAQQFIGAT